jgi:hypothetical protein
LPSKDELKSCSVPTGEIHEYLNKISNNVNYGIAQNMAKKEDLNYYIHIYKKKALSEDDSEDRICFEFYPLFPIESQPKKEPWAVSPEEVSAKDLKDIKDSIEENLHLIYQKMNTKINVKFHGKSERLDDNVEKEENDISENICKIESTGEDLMKLIKLEFPEEITTTLEKPNKYIWLFCEVKEVSCLWEWIYLKPSEKFLGDEFLLVRLPGHANFKYDQTNFKIENPVAWMDKNKNSKDQISNLESKLREVLKCGLQKKVIRKFALFNPFEKHVADFIHIAAKEAKIDKIVKGNDINFVFSNICECSHPLYFKVKESAIPTNVIETSFKIPEKFSSSFAENFYYDFLNKKMTMADAFMDVRKTSLNGNDWMKVWRLAYVMCGNPFAKVIR